MLTLPSSATAPGAGDLDGLGGTGALKYCLDEVGLPLGAEAGLCLPDAGRLDIELIGFAVLGRCGVEPSSKFHEYLGDLGLPSLSDASLSRSPSGY